MALLPNPFGPGRRLVFACMWKLLAAKCAFYNAFRNQQWAKAHDALEEIDPRGLTEVIFVDFKAKRITRRMHGGTFNRPI